MRFTDFLRSLSDRLGEQRSYQWPEYLTAGFGCSCGEYGGSHQPGRPNLFCECPCHADIIDPDLPPCEHAECHEPYEDGR